MRRGLFRRDERGISDLLGTMILLGVTVTIVGVAGAQFIRSASQDPEAPSLEARVNAKVGDNFLQLVHLGGAELPANDLRVVVTVNGTAWYTGDLGASATTWRVGGNHTIQPLVGNLPYGGRIDVTLASKARGAVVANIVTTLPLTEAGTAPLAAGFAVTVRFDGNLSTGNVTPPGYFFIYSTVSHPEGRKAIRSVTINLTAFNGSATTPLIDDGTSGDILAGDGIYSNSAWVPAGVLGPSRNLTAAATDVHGNRVTGTGLVYVNDPSTTQAFLRTVFNATGNRMLKIDGGSSGDKVTPHLKFQLATYPLQLEDNSTWNLNKVEMIYVPLKQQSDTPVTLDLGQVCANATTFVYHKASSGNLTISNYYMDRDDFRYYYKVTFKNTASNVYFTTSITGAQDYDYFIMRGSDPHKIVQDSANNWPPWPQTFTDCTP